MNHSEGLALPNYKSLSTQTRYYAPLLGLLPDNRPVSIPISTLLPPPPPSPTPMNHSEGLALPNYKSLSTQTRYYAPLLGLLPDNRPVSIPISPPSPPPPPSPTPMNHSEGLALPNYKSLSTQTRYYAPLLGLLPDNRPVSIPISPPSPPPPPSPTPMNHSEGLALPNYKSLSTQTRYYAPLLGLLPDNRPVSIPISPPSPPPPPPPHLHPWTTVRVWHCLTTRVSQHRHGTTPPSWVYFLITDLWVFLYPPLPPPPPPPHLHPWTTARA